MNNIIDNNNILDAFRLVGIKIKEINQIEIIKMSLLFLKVKK